MLLDRGEVTRKKDMKWEEVLVHAFVQHSNREPKELREIRQLVLSVHQRENSLRSRVSTISSQTGANTCKVLIISMITFLDSVELSPNSSSAVMKCLYSCCISSAA